jgi:hypothetical protein
MDILDQSVMVLSILVIRMKMIAPMMQIALILVSEHMIVYVTTVSKAMLLFVQILTTVMALHVVTTLHVQILGYLLITVRAVMDILVVVLKHHVILTTTMTALTLFAVPRVTTYALMKVYSVTRVRVQMDMQVVVSIQRAQSTFKMTVLAHHVGIVLYVRILVY